MIINDEYNNINGRNNKNNNCDNNDNKNNNKECSCTVSIEIANFC